MTSNAKPESRKQRPIPVLSHLSGHYRGRILRLDGDRLEVGSGPEADVRFSIEDLTPGAGSVPGPEPYAVLERMGATFELIAALEADIWITGRRVERRVLESGDVIEIGEGGPVLRYRLYPAGSAAYKSVAEAFADCVRCVRHGRGVADRAGALVIGGPRELLTRTAPWVRAVTLAVILALVVSAGWLWSRTRGLERQLEEESRLAQALAQLLEEGSGAPGSREDVSALREALRTNRSRIEALEARSEARVRVIETSSRSVVFVQGSWGFDAPDGRPLRFAAVGPDGAPRVGPDGPELALDGDGPPVEILCTGTAFVVGSDGLLLTNRHVAMPWDYDAPVTLLESHGLKPVIRRFLGYLPGVPEPFEVELVRASDKLDVALLRCAPLEEEILPLKLAEVPPHVGDEVIVLGYPTGINALLARADPAAVQEILESGPNDFWSVAERLAARDLIAPLATVGVVGQASTTSIVYDAETTHGGSGGPVLDLEGMVLAVNAAILREFGGSNLGVPAAEGLRLLRTDWDADRGP